MEDFICRGECLFGKCPHKTCIKHTVTKEKTELMQGTMSILTDFNIENIRGNEGYGIIADIGTTTVAVYLYDMLKGKQLGIVSQINSQAVFGIDVISRIKYSRDIPNGLKNLNKAIINQLNNMFDKVCIKAKIAMEEISKAVIVGNTIMLHLLCNISPASMGALPFKPKSYFGNEMRASSIGLSIKNANVFLPHSISAFVGADTSAGILASGFFDIEEGYYLLVDIGTNGEIALGNNKKIFVTSTAAGPAFEGAHISCGMAGIGGAIKSVYIENGCICYTTINNEKPRGVCGSGLLDAVALFCNIGFVDETGRIVCDDKKYLFEHDGQPALKIVDGIFITQKDIRELQTAKASVAAGIETLIYTAKIEHANIKKLFISGGFGSFMNKNSARCLGIIPADIETEFIGNGAAAGAALLLISDEAKKKLHSIKNRAVQIELANSPYFTEKYIDYMCFSQYNV